MDDDDDSDDSDDDEYNDKDDPAMSSHSAGVDDQHDPSSGRDCVNAIREVLRTHLVIGLDDTVTFVNHLKDDTSKFKRLEKKSISHLPRHFSVETRTETSRLAKDAIATRDGDQFIVPHASSTGVIWCSLDQEASSLAPTQSIHPDVIEAYLDILEQDLSGAADASKKWRPLIMPPTWCYEKINSKERKAVFDKHWQNPSSIQMIFADLFRVRMVSGYGTWGAPGTMCHLLPLPSTPCTHVRQRDPLPFQLLRNQ